MAEGPAQQEGGGNVEASAVVNSKRQRRPSVRLGEIGEMPVAVLLDRPLKRRKRRAAASAPPASAALGLLLEDGNVGEAGQDADMEMDPTAVDMTGFNEEDPARIAWDRPPRTRPLLHVATTTRTLLAHKGMDENSEDGLYDNGGGLESAGNHDDKDGDDKHENSNGLLPELKSSTPRKGKYGRRRRVAASRAAAATWRARKAVAAATATAAAAGVAKKTKESRNVPSPGRVSGDPECNGVLKEDDNVEEQKHDRGRGNTTKSSQRRVSKSNSGDVGAKDEHDELVLSGDEEPLLQENHLGDSLEEDSEDTAAARDHNETTHLTEEHERFVLPDFVRNWLEEKRLGKYSELFEFHEVDEDVLPLLTMEDLREMGIVAVGARRKLFHAIQGLG